MGAACSYLAEKVDGVPVVRDSVKDGTKISTAVFYNGTEYTVDGSVMYKKGAKISIWRAVNDKLLLLAPVEAGSQNIRVALNGKTIWKGDEECAAIGLARKIACTLASGLVCTALLCVAYGLSSQSIPSFASGWLVISAASISCPYLAKWFQSMFVAWGVAN